MGVAKIAIIDNEPKVVDQIKSFLNKMYKERQITVPFTIQAFTAQEFQAEIEQKPGGYNLLIMDIWLEVDIDGLTLAKRAMINYETEVIFMSGYKVEYLPLIKENAAMHFVIKPVTYGKLYEAMTPWLERVRQQCSSYTFTVNGEPVTLSVSEILYIEVREKALFLMTRDQKQYQFKGQIKVAEEQLAPLNFIRCHHSFCINVQYLSEIKQKERCGEAILCFRDNSVVSVPISVRKRQAVIAAYKRYLKEGRI